MLAKKLSKFLETHFEDSLIAIISSNKSERASIKKLLVDEGVNLSCIEQFDNFRYAKEAIEEKPIPFIICDDEIGEVSCEDFLIEHERIYPNRARTLFICQTQTAPSSLKSLQEQSRIDFILKKPYIVNTAVKNIISSFTKKLEKLSDPQYSEFWELTEKMSSESFKNLLKLIPQYRIDNPESLDAIYLEGLFYEKQNLLDESIDRKSVV